MAKAKVYESKAVTTTIKVTSRASIQLTGKGGTSKFFTVEYGEERSVPEDCNIEEERKLLWDDCNAEVDNQIQEIMDTFRK